MLEELDRRDGLIQAIARRNDRGIEPLLRVIQRNISRPEYSAILTKAMNVVLNEYGNVLAESKLTMDILKNMQSILLKDMRELEHMQHLSGTLRATLSLWQLQH